MDIREIEEEIEDLELSETTWQNIDKLSQLYIIRNNFIKDGQSYGDSEFLKACENVDVKSLLILLDEHMEIIRMLHPKEYSALIDRIHQL